MVVGCNGWAWAFLAKSAGAGALLPDPVTVRPFDAARLHEWFVSLAKAEATGSMRFRLPGTGEDVLAVDEQGAARSDYLRRLAGEVSAFPGWRGTCGAAACARAMTRPWRTTRGRSSRIGDASEQRCG